MQSKILKIALINLLAFGIFSCASTAVVEEAVVENDFESITEKDLYTHLSFIASDELEGRDTPSRGLNIAAKYLATRLESYGLEPLASDGSYFQKIPFEVTHRTGELTITKGDNTSSYAHQNGILVGSNAKVELSGGLVFAGYGVSLPDDGWDDFKDLDVQGKFVVILNGRLPQDHKFNATRNDRIKVVTSRSRSARQAGAKGVIRVIAPSREKRLQDTGTHLESRLPARLEGDNRRRANAGNAEWIDISVRHGVAMELLGVSESEINEWFASIGRGEMTGSRMIENVSVTITTDVETKVVDSQNVVAKLEGTDPVLKNEFVLYGAHYDHVGAREGRIWNGADDDGSGTVTLLEIAQAFSKNPPRRSVVFVWHAGEERGLLGAKYFSENPLIPLEKASAQINIDMVGRNANNQISVIGANRISTELHDLHEKVNNEHIGMELDYTYNDPKDPNRFYERSDHYMYARFGVPILFYFNDVHEDYHQPTDTVEKIDFNKMQKIGRLAYLLGKEIANKDSMLKLDADPKVTARGKLIKR